jgi:hypothetical protein
MSDEGSLIVRPRDYSDICKLGDPSVLEQFLDEPATLIAETITGAFATGKTGLIVAGGRIVQGLLKGQDFKQFGREFRALRDAGKIPDDFAEKKYGFQTWVELMTTIDEDSPDADRLEALKAMFYAVNRVSQDDSGRIVDYQLWRITKQLNSGDLLLLKTFCERGDMGAGNGGGQVKYNQWLTVVTQASGFALRELVELHIARLQELKLLTGRDSQESYMPAEISSLGRKLCTNITTYNNELRGAVS